MLKSSEPRSCLSGLCFHRVRFVTATDLPVMDHQQAFDLTPREAPVLADFHPFETTIVQHAVDRDAVYLEIFQNLASCE